MEQIAQYAIYGLLIIATVVTSNKIRILFKKKERYHDSVGASRKQNDLIGRSKKQ